MKTKKKKFTIGVTRIGYGYINFEVEATNQKEAEEIALENAGNHEFSEHSSEYILAASNHKNDRMGEYLSKQDFKLLKQQKFSIIYLIGKLEKAMQGKKVRFTQKEIDTLEGMLCFIDSIQDIAVDEYGYPERTVFRKTREKSE